VVDLAVPESRSSWARRSLPPAVAALLARARDEQGLTVAQAAERIGISPRYLRQLEAGQRTMSTVVAEALVVVYELAPDDVERLRGAALPGVGRAYRKVPQQLAAAVVERADSGEVRLFPEPEPLPSGIQSRVVRPSPYA
jgi:transcriptional regulator with XRE-family HTH domain